MGFHRKRACTLSASLFLAALWLAAFGVADQAAAGVVFTGQFGTGNTWNVYESINTPFSFKQALAFAATRSDPTGGSAVGHLVTISRLAENSFVHTTAGGGDRWIGLTDRFGVAPGASESRFAFDPATEGWAWVTGEPFTFQNWGGGEPNNAGAGEDAAHLRHDSLWNDNASGFGFNDPVEDAINFDSPAEPEATIGFIIEWETLAATEPTGFPLNRPEPGLPRVFPTPLARLPGPNGTASAWGSLAVTGLGASGGTRAAVAKVLSGAGTLVEGTLARFDIIDPETNAGTAGSVNGPTVPFVSNTAGDDNNFQTVVKGTIQVSAGQGGPYTFNVRSDDGFAMRILSQASEGPFVQHPFTAARTGLVDEDGTLTFLAPTGDSNTQGVVNLSPGTYDVEFLMFEDTGGAFAEVSTQRGDFVNNPPNALPQWILLGDGSSLPAMDRPFQQPVRLTGPATVRNYTRGTQTVVADVVANIRSGATPTAEGTIEAVVLNGEGGLGINGGNLSADMVHQFPNGTGVDNFTTAVRGGFTVLDTNGAAGETLTFGLFADDNAAIHIVGNSFTGVADFSPDGSAVLDNPEGAADPWLIADYRTPNTNAFGLITLPEGNYEFESFQLEEGGNSALEIWVAQGDQLATGFDAARFFPLTTVTLPTIFAANQGLSLAPACIPGDTGPCDGRVDIDDLNNVRNHFGAMGDPDGTLPGDAFPFDGRVNIDDLNGVRNNFGSATAAAVPEPSAIAMILLLCLGFVVVRPMHSLRQE